MQIEHEFLMLGDAALSPHRFVDQCNELFELIARIGIGFHISGKFWWLRHMYTEHTNTVVFSYSFG